MTAIDGNALHREVARAALDAAATFGFALGGGVAWVTHGLVVRPTEDVDLFTDTDGAVAAAAEQVCDALTSAGFGIDSELAEADLSELFEGFDLDLREYQVSRDGAMVRLSLGRLDRRHVPVLLDVGPVLHMDDLVASKVAALVNRRAVRDYIDVAAALDRYTQQELLRLAQLQDPGIDPDDIVEAGRYLDRLSDRRFQRYGLDAGQVASLRAKLAGWPRERGG